jgi:hypothetical protein
MGVACADSPPRHSVADGATGIAPTCHLGDAGLDGILTKLIRHLICAAAQTAAVDR